jgi:catechol 2,3-dioxygenase-like lactoylglutathione lyase family enzyme
VSIVPVICCRDLEASLAFYTEILDFEPENSDTDIGDRFVIWLSRQGAYLILTRENGVRGNLVVVTTNDVDGDFRRFRERGLKTPGDPDNPQLVHEGPIDQTWGSREFYVEDPDGNTLRFTQWLT